MTDQSWKAKRLNKGQVIGTDHNGCYLSVGRVDRVADPYLAGVVRDDKIIHTGLYPTLSAAKKACLEWSRSDV